MANTRPLAQAAAQTIASFTKFKDTLSSRIATIERIASSLIPGTPTFRRKAAKQIIFNTNAHMQRIFWSSELIPQKQLYSKDIKHFIISLEVSDRPFDFFFGIVILISLLSGLIGAPWLASEISSIWFPVQSNFWTTSSSIGATLIIALVTYMTLVWPIYPRIKNRKKYKSLTMSIFFMRIWSIICGVIIGTRIYNITTNHHAIDNSLGAIVLTGMFTGIAMFVIVLLMNLLNRTFDLLRDFVKRADYPFAMLTVNLLEILYLLENNGTLWKDTRIQNSIITRLNSVRLCLKTYIPAHYNSLHPKNYVIMHSEFQKMSNVVARLQNNVVMPTESTRQDIIHYIQQMLPITINREWGNAPTAENADTFPEARFRAVMHFIGRFIRTLLFALLPLCIFIIIQKPPLSLSGSYIETGMTISIFWAIVRLLTVGDPQSHKTIEAVKSISELFSWPGSKSKGP